MGAEHGYLDRLWAYGTNQPAAFLPVTPGFAGNLSPNQRELTLACWCLQPARGVFTGPLVGRALEFFALQDEQGHCCEAPGGRTEILTPSHWQLWAAAVAGILLAARQWHSKTLEAAATAWWRKETALCRLGVARGDHADGVIRLPGARAGNPGQGLATNPLRDTVIGALLDGWQQPVPRTPKQGSYAAVIPLLKKAFAAGVNPADLVGDDASLPPRLDLRFYRHDNGDHYAHFADGLMGAYDPLWGAGYIDGQPVLDWQLEAANARAELLGGREDWRRA